MRNRFDEQLCALNNELITMGALCEEAIAYAVKLLIDGDSTMKENVIETDRQIDHKEREIDRCLGSECPLLVFRQNSGPRNTWLECWMCSFLESAWWGVRLLKSWTSVTNGVCLCCCILGVGGLCSWLGSFCLEIPTTLIFPLPLSHFCLCMTPI